MSHFVKNYRMAPYDAIDPALPALSQKGRTVLITGGSTGIGFAIARAFIAADAGCVIIAGRNESTLARAKSKLENLAPDSSTIVDFAAFDLASEASIRAAWTDFKTRDIGIDVLVLSATSFSSSFKISSPEALKDVRRWNEVTVLGNLDMTASFIAQGQQRGKVLVNISTAAAHWTPSDQPIYATLKAAFVHALQAVADEQSREDIQIISLHPGAILTDAAVKAGYTEDTIPWDHVDLPARFVLWAASKEATFLHGRFLWANWDVDELKAMQHRFEKDADLLRFGLKGVEHVHPQKMWEHISDIAKAKR